MDINDTTDTFLAELKKDFPKYKNKMEPVFVMRWKHELLRNTQMCLVFLFPIFILLLTTIFRKYLCRILTHAHKTYYMISSTLLLNKRTNEIKVLITGSMYSYSLQALY